MSTSPSPLLLKRVPRHLALLGCICIRMTHVPAIRTCLANLTEWYNCMNINDLANDKAIDIWSADLMRGLVLEITSPWSHMQGDCAALLESMIVLCNDNKTTLLKDVATQVELCNLGQTLLVTPNFKLFYNLSRICSKLLPKKDIALRLKHLFLEASLTKGIIDAFEAFLTETGNFRWLLQLHQERIAIGTGLDMQEFRAMTIDNVIRDIAFGMLVTFDTYIAVVFECDGCHEKYYHFTHIVKIVSSIPGQLSLFSRNPSDQQEEHTILTFDSEHDAKQAERYCSKAKQQDDSSNRRYKASRSNKDIVAPSQKHSQNNTTKADRYQRIEDMANAASTGASQSESNAGKLGLIKMPDVLFTTSHENESDGVLSRSVQTHSSPRISDIVTKNDGSHVHARLTAVNINSELFEDMCSSLSDVSECHFAPACAPVVKRQPRNNLEVEKLFDQFECKAGILKETHLFDSHIHAEQLPVEKGDTETHELSAVVERSGSLDMASVPKRSNIVYDQSPALSHQSRCDHEILPSTPSIATDYEALSSSPRRGSAALVQNPKPARTSFKGTLRDRKLVAQKQSNVNRTLENESCTAPVRTNALLTTEMQASHNDKASVITEALQDIKQNLITEVHIHHSEDVILAMHDRLPAGTQEEVSNIHQSPVRVLENSRDYIDPRLIYPCTRSPPKSRDNLPIEDLPNASSNIRQDRVGRLRATPQASETLVDDDKLKLPRIVKWDAITGPAEEERNGGEEQSTVTNQICSPALNSRLQCILPVAGETVCDKHAPTGSNSDPVGGPRTTEVQLDTETQANDTCCVPKESRVMDDMADTNTLSNYTSLVACPDMADSHTSTKPPVSNPVRNLLQKQTKIIDPHLSLCEVTSDPRDPQQTSCMYSPLRKSFQASINTPSYRGSRVLRSGRFLDDRMNALSGSISKIQQVTSSEKVVSSKSISSVHQASAHLNMVSCPGFELPKNDFYQTLRNKGLVPEEKIVKRTKVVPSKATATSSAESESGSQSANDTMIKRASKRRKGNRRRNKSGAYREALPPHQKDTFDIMEEITREIISKVQDQESILAAHASKYAESVEGVRDTLREHQSATFEDLWSKVQAAAQEALSL